MLSGDEPDDTHESGDAQWLQQSHDEIEELLLTVTLVEITE
jgi:hypothetical protein